MAMNASAQSLIALITGANLRFVIPVYQRPYSWGEDECLQLWEDVLDVGKRPQDRHFTGSVVWVQDGVMDASGVTPLLIIDGQQRVTTLTLMIAALADFSRSHPERSDLRFSHREIMTRGYLVDEFRQGEGRYKLTLSQGDRSVLIALLENLIDDDHKLPEGSGHIMENFALFRRRIEAMENPSLVWDGIQRLDVVSISLDAGRDNPQLIFESMNSTGKALSSADLIRNYVLMGFPREEQDKLYLNHWRAIEEALGADSYDEVFDEFVRNYLTVLHAPEPLARRDIYAIFKRHVKCNGYDKEGRIVDLLRQMEEFAHYYACIANGKETEPDLKRTLDGIARLNAAVVNPLLLSLYDDYAAGSFPMDDFISMAELLESYILRRAVVEAPTNSLSKFFASLIAKMNRVQNEGGNYREAFESFLLAEAGTSRRFPTNDEFENALVTRDAYHFRRCFYLLRELEKMHHPKDNWELDPSAYTIEHVMPQNARTHEEWLAVLTEEDQENFESLCNNLGNLTLTAYNSELSDGTFKQKREHIVGGYDKECLVISKAIKDSDNWTPASITKRARTLAKDAAERWRYPDVTAEAAAKYEPKPGKLPKAKSKMPMFRSLVEEGAILPGTVLEPVSGRYDIRATVTNDGSIRLPNGEEFASPSRAAIRSAELSGGSTGARNGWNFWRVESGAILNSLRKEYLQDGNESDRAQFLAAWWTGFYDYCGEQPGFADAFGDPSERIAVKEAWSSFRLGLPKTHIDALVARRDSWVGAEMWFADCKTYARLYKRRDELEAGPLAGLAESLEWNNLDAAKKTRVVIAKRPCNFDADAWEDLYATVVEWLYAMRAAILAVYSRH